MQNSWLENRIHKWHYDHLEGGGGVSDLTHKKITISFSGRPSGPAFFNGAFILADSPVGEVSYYQQQTAVDTTFDIILYKNKAGLELTPPIGYAVGDISGGIEDTDGFYIVTDDCTINFIQNT